MTRQAMATPLTQNYLVWQHDPSWGGRFFVARLPYINQRWGSLHCDYSAVVKEMCVSAPD